MGVDLMTFAIVMACLAVGATLYFLFAETSEAHDIRHDGWTRGHHHGRH